MHRGKSHSKKVHLLIGGKPQSRAPWATRPKICVWVAKARSCDMPGLYFYCVVRHAISVTRSLLITITQGGSHSKNMYKPGMSQLRALATHTPILGRVAQGAWDCGLPPISRCNFLSDPCLCAQVPIETFYILSYNKQQADIKSICTEERGGKLWQLQICVQISVVSGVLPPMTHNSILLLLSDSR